MSNAIVTGAARGIGAAIARKLAAQGMSVALLDLDKDGARKVASEIYAAGHEAEAFVCDVSRKDSVQAALEAVAVEYGDADVLINNAGIGGPFHRIDEVSDDEWELVMSTNLKSVFLFARELLPKMKARGYGRIVNVASIQALGGAARSSTYVASKHAVVGYTRAIAAEWGEFGITCNAVCPGYVDTSMGIQTGKVANHLAQVLARSPVKRIGTPEEIASLVGFLAGGESGYVNGAVWTIDGGITANLGVS